MNARFGVTCVNGILENVCPNCGGGFVARPIRPKTARRAGVSLNHQAASVNRVNTQYSIEEIKKFSAQTKQIKPEDR